MIISSLPYQNLFAYYILKKLIFLCVEDNVVHCKGAMNRTKGNQVLKDTR